MADSKEMTGYRLSKLSGVPQTTVTDLLSGKASLLKCNSETLYRLSKVLGIPMETLIDAEIQEKAAQDAFDVFRKGELTSLKNKGDIPYLLDLFKSGRIRRMYNKNDCAEAFYLLALADYLSRLHSVPLAQDYNDIREKKLAKPLYLHTSPKANHRKKGAIKEFQRFGIIEMDIRSLS